MGLSLRGATSGAIDINPPAVAGDNTITLPVNNGSANQFFKNSGTAGIVTYSSMVETSTGVGIGTDNPSDDLSILATPNSLVIGCKDSTRGNHVFQLLADDSAGNGELRLYQNSGSGTHAKTVEIASSGNSYINGGNVGIGTDNPAVISGMSKYLTLSSKTVDHAVAFELQGNRTGSDQTVGRISFINNTNEIARINVDSASGGSNGNLTFTISGTERLRITSGGLVDVSGGIHVTENVTPTSGRGVEIFQAGTGVGQIQSYNRNSSGWDELRIKGSEVKIYTGTTNGLGLNLAAAASTLYGTSDGIFNLDTTDGRGPFIRFKENGTTKAWVGSAEGMGGGLSGDQDDLGMRAVDNIMFSANGAERLRIESTGDVTIKNGNLILGTAGNGISFINAADTATNETVSSSVLDDYEEGTWSPTIGGTATYDIQWGYYIRVGKLVQLWGGLRPNSMGSGNARMIQNLPYTCINSPGSTYSGGGTIVWCDNSATSFTNTPSIMVDPNANTARIALKSGASSGLSAILQDNFDFWQVNNRANFYICYYAKT